MDPACSSREGEKMARKCILLFLICFIYDAGVHRARGIGRIQGRGGNQVFRNRESLCPTRNERGVHRNRGQDLYGKLNSFLEGTGVQGEQRSRFRNILYSDVSGEGR